MSALDRYPVGVHKDLRGFDTCDQCAYSRPELVRGLTARGTPTAATMLLCTHETPREHYNGSRVTAGCAREFVCHGRLFKRGASA